MVRPELVHKGLSELALRVERLRALAKPNPASLAADRDALELTAFNVMLAVQDCADVATHVISDEGWPMPRTLGDGFTRLAEHGVITRHTAQRMVAAVGLRNVVAHAYDTLDAAKLHAASTEGLLDLDRFAREVAAWLSSPPPAP